jgi:uncharacterized membrane-anchored protein YjiN (DUF445 family)
MRWIATGLLLLMAAVFAVATALSSRWPATLYVRAFAEAAVIGACADWFAVTALFRRPFGLPIPHTAIIPRNKDRIGDALGRFIVENFLSARVLDSRLKRLELGAWGGAWLQQPRNAQAVAARIVAWAPMLAGALPAGGFKALAGSLALAAARKVPASTTASVLLAAAWNEGRVQPLIERGAALLSAYLSEQEGVILEKVQGQSWRWLPKWVDKAIARKITAGLVQLLTDVQDPAHPWRLELTAAIQKLIADLASDPELMRKGEAIKQQLLDDPRLHEHAARLWAEIEEQARAGWSGDAAALRDKLQPLIEDLGRWLSEDKVVQRTLNTNARVLAREVLAPRREEIGRFIAQVVHGWDARGMVERLELQVGPDLQFIRINGTLVGGLVGLALFALSRALGWSE